MRDLLRGYATAILESAATAGHALEVANDLDAFSRALTESDPLRNVLTDGAIPARARRGVVHDLLDAKAAAESQALVSWAALVEPAPEFPVAVLALVELALETADAADAGQVRTVPAEELLGGRTAVRERIRGYADRLFQEVDRLELIDDIEDELVRFARILDSSRGLRHALGDPSTAVAQRVALAGDLLKGQGAGRDRTACRVRAGGRPHQGSRRYARVGRRARRRGAGAARRRGALGGRAR